MEKESSEPMRFPKMLHGADYNYEQWLDYPDILKMDFKAMVQARCNVMSVGIFSWSKLERSEEQYDFSWMDTLLDSLHDHGLQAILATPSGSKPAWLSRKYPEVCRVNSSGVRDRHGGRHNHCRTSPVFRRACERINRKLAERYRNHPALLMWHVSNEYNGDPCYCDLCQTAFRAWLKKRYGNLESLNKAWWTDFWSHRFYDWEEIVPGDASIQGLMLDWFRFTSSQTLDFFRCETAVLKEIAPEIPLTTNFMRPDVRLDYWDFAPHVDMVSWDSYPRWHIRSDDSLEASETAFFHDLSRSYKGRSFMLMESTPEAINWQNVSKNKEPGMHLLSSLQAVAHGSDTVQYFQWRQSRGGTEKFHGAVMSHLNSTDTRVFRSVSQVGALLESLPELCGSAVKSEVAVIYDYHNSWALEHAELTRNEEKNYQEQCIAHHRALWRKNIAVDVCDSVHCDFSRYRLVVMPMLYMFRPGFSERLSEYVKNGGVVLATYLTGLVDQNDLCFINGVPGENIHKIFGITLESNGALAPDENQNLKWKGENYAVSHYIDLLQIQTAHIEGAYTEGFMKEHPGLTRNTFGKGEAWYLGARGQQNLLEELYSHLCRSAGVQSEWRSRSEPPAGVSIQMRHSRDSRYAFLMNFTREKQVVPVPETGWSCAYRNEDFDSSSLQEGDSLSLMPFGTAVLTQKKSTENS